MNAQAVLIEEEIKKPIMTMFHALFSIGIVVGGLSGGFYTSMESGLLPHFLTTGLISASILIVSSFFLFKDPKRQIDDDVLFAWPKGPIIGLGIIAFCCMLGEGAMTDWSTNYMKHIVGSPKDWQTFGLIAFAAMMTLGRLVGDQGRLIFGDRKMMLTGSLLSLIGMVLVLSLAHTFVVIIGFGMVGLGLSNIVPIVYSLAGTYPGIQPGVGIAMSTTIGYSGFMIGPPLIGFVADLFNLRVALVLLGLLFVIMSVLVFGYRPQIRKVSS